jgi:ABC-type multidrug transport system fused ATPase/permease subunit
LRRASTANAFIAAAPRIVVEIAGFVAIGGIAWYFASRPAGIAPAIPTLGAMALGAQRLLPLMQQAFIGWSSFFGNRQNLSDVADMLRLPDATDPTPPRPAAFRDSLTFDHVDFAYWEGGPVLEGIDLAIRKGERIGIVGRTGSGKSTMMDLMLGLLAPTGGQILVDGEPLDRELRSSWRAQVAHVPQSIYLSDDSLAANIAFGVRRDAIDMDRVRQAAAAAGIADFIEGLAQGYETRCGERGVRLSGGQRQRIGIARALYKRATVLIFDEATSALDSDTEKSVIDAISGLGDELTLIMIAHRLTTLSGCDRIILLNQGRIERIVNSVAELDGAA